MNNDNYRVFQWGDNGDLISLGDYFDEDSTVDIGAVIILTDSADVEFKAKIMEIHKANPALINRGLCGIYEPDPIVIVGNKIYK